MEASLASPVLLVHLLLRVAQNAIVPLVKSGTLLLDLAPPVLLVNAGILEAPLVEPVMLVLILQRRGAHLAPTVLPANMLL